MRSLSRRKLISGAGAALASGLAVRETAAETASSSPTPPVLNDASRLNPVPPERLADFLAACRAIIPPSGQDLLNITLRYVDADASSVLTSARRHASPP
jgi:hypothetical protein